MGSNSVSAPNDPVSAARSDRNSANRGGSTTSTRGKKKSESEELTYDHLTTFKIIAEANRPDVSIFSLAKEAEITPTGMYYCLRGMRKWNAETWLRALVVLGIAEITEGQIIIHTDVTDDVLQALQKKHKRKKGRAKPRSKNR